MAAKVSMVATSEPISIKHRMNKGWSDWVAEQKHDLYFVLRYSNLAYPRGLNSEQLSKQVCHLFYRLECDEWGYQEAAKPGFHARHSRWGRKYSRIHRCVCIEEKSGYHANILVKRYGNYSDEELIDKFRTEWMRIQKWKKEPWSYLFQPDDYKIRENLAVSKYSVKDTEKESANLDDVLCMRASFIQK